MAVKISAGLLMYRFGSKGLEVFLVQPKEEGAESAWEIPKSYVNQEEGSLETAKRELLMETGMEPDEEEFIQLDAIQGAENEVVEAWAVEGSERDFVLPLQGLLGKTESPLKLRRRHRYVMENGAYFVFKEAVKKVFPEQVTMIKELQEIVTTRNMIKNL